METPEELKIEIAARFVARLLSDQKADRERALSEYLDGLPPAHQVFVAAEYVRILGAQPSVSVVRGAEAHAEDDEDRSLSGSGQPIDRIGPYRIIQEIGRGGQGVVYLAEDTRLHRQVALKVLDRLAAGDGLRRFQREAELTSKLDHPGICTVFDAGTVGSSGYIAMKFIEGESLARRIASTREDTESSPPSTVHIKDERSKASESQVPRSGKPGPDTERDIRDILDIIEKTARALHSAHDAGVIHRDIKPGNIMITPDGTPVVLDFGMAQNTTGEDATLTLSGELFGTPAYMSPEQLLAKRIPLDRRTDVYSLGVSLFECLTLRKPFEAPTKHALYHAIQTKQPPALRRLNRAVSRDLEVVVQTAIEKDRDRRYQSAVDFAEDLRRVREREPIKARPVGPAGRVVQWARRNPVVATLSSALFLALVSGLVVSLVLYADAETARVREGEKSREAEKNAAEAIRNLDYYNRLADARILEDLLREQEEDLWPAVPGKAAAMEKWLDRARELEETLRSHEAALADLRKLAKPYTDAMKVRDRASHKVELDEIANLEAERNEIQQALDKPAASSFPEAQRRGLEKRYQEAEEKLIAARTRLEPVLSERLTYEFDDPNLDLRIQWRHDKLSELVRGLKFFAAGGSKDSGIAGVAARLEFARTLRRRTVEDHADPWNGCLDRVAKNTKYEPGTLSVEQLGLIPLGQDPVTKLEEFVETATGDPPVRDPSTGRPVVTEKTSMVFVLLPGGTFTMGAQDQDPNGLNFDRQARGDESPPHEVKLAPFLLSKYEMTQGQWLRLMGVNPSFYHPDGGFGTDLRHPVEQVDWEDCRRAAARLGFRLPSETQWEYGCRAETRMVWSTGNDVASLAGFANICDEVSMKGYPAEWQFEPGFEDGHPFTAAVDSLKPNGFGLHDMHGNIWEWCEDGYGTYPGRPAARDGLRVVPGARHRVSRGGSFSNLTVFARSAFRNSGAPSDRNCFLGFRAARSITP